MFIRVTYVIMCICTYHSILKDYIFIVIDFIQALASLCEICGLATFLYLYFVYFKGIVTEGRGEGEGVWWLSKQGLRQLAALWLTGPCLVFRDHMHPLVAKG